MKHKKPPVWGLLYKGVSVKKTLVLGLGNILMNDDAAGVLVAQNLSKKYPDTEQIRIMDGGTLGLDLLGYIEWADKLIVVDAVDIGHPAGTVVRIEGEDIDPVFENKLSPHQMGLKDLLGTAMLTGGLPAEIVLFGIQTESIQMEQELSKEVAANMEKLEKETEKELLKEFR